MEKSEICEQLKKLGIDWGMTVIVQIGQFENDKETLLNALKDCVSSDGQILIAEEALMSSLPDNCQWYFMIGADYPDCLLLNVAEKYCKKTAVSSRTEEFRLVGTAFENRFWGDESAIRFAKIGTYDGRLINMNLFIDYAADWMFKNRK